MSNYSPCPSIIIEEPASVRVRKSTEFAVAVEVDADRGVTIGFIYLSYEAARDLVGKLTDALAVTS